MSITERILSLVAPFECINCGGEGRLLCWSCTSLLSYVPERCYKCSRASTGFITCKKCRASTKIKVLYAAVIYEGLSRELIWRLKYKSAKSSAKEIAELMSFPLDCDYVVPVPTTNRRVRVRGYDQAKLIAKAISKNTKTPYQDALTRLGSKNQVGSSRIDRRKQLQGAFRVKNKVEIKGKHILLVDDVLTTGSTLEEAARAIKVSGAKHVSATVFAQAD